MIAVPDAYKEEAALTVRDRLPPKSSAWSLSEWNVVLPVMANLTYEICKVKIEREVIVKGDRFCPIDAYPL
jgi:hypothetical protein